MNRSMLAVTAAIVVGAVAHCPAASAAAIIDTGTPTYSPYVGSPALYRDMYGSQSLAAGFSLSAETTISDIDAFVGINAFNGVPQNGSLDIVIRADTIRALASPPFSGRVPGAAIKSATLALSGLALDPSWVGLSGLDWVLTAGDYWVSFEPVSINGFMPTGGISTLTKTAYNSSGQGWLPGAGQGINIGVRVFSADSPMPEPSTWLSLVVGFGVIGFSERNRRRKHARLDVEAK